MQRDLVSSRVRALMGNPKSRFRLIDAYIAKTYENPKVNTGFESLVIDTETVSADNADLCIDSLLANVAWVDSNGDGRFVSREDPRMAIDNAIELSKPTPPKPKSWPDRFLEWLHL